MTVKGDGSYTSPAFMPGSVGGYQWVATYSGDYRNSPVSTRCNDPNEQSVVSKARPSLSTTASAPVTLGQPIGDTAVLSGGVSPTGSITWNLYAAGTNCATSLFTSSAVPVSGDGTYTSPAYRPTAAGTYQWVATYSGDPNNSTFTSWCNESSEQSVVQAPVTPPTTPTPATTPTPPAAPETTVAKQAVAPIKIFRCGPHKVKKDKKVHGKTVTVCVAKKRAPARRHAPAPTFTG